MGGDCTIQSGLCFSWKGQVIAQYPLTYFKNDKGKKGFHYFLFSDYISSEINKIIIINWTEHYVHSGSF